MSMSQPRSLFALITVFRRRGLIMGEDTSVSLVHGPAHFTWTLLEDGVCRAQFVPTLEESVEVEGASDPTVVAPPLEVENGDFGFRSSYPVFVVNDLVHAFRGLGPTLAPDRAGRVKDFVARENILFLSILTSLAVEYKADALVMNGDVAGSDTWKSEPAPPSLALPAFITTTPVDLDTWVEVRLSYAGADIARQHDHAVIPGQMFTTTLCELMRIFGGHHLAPGKPSPFQSVELNPPTSPART